MKSRCYFNRRDFNSKVKGKKCRQIIIMTGCIKQNDNIIIIKIIMSNKRAVYAVYSVYTYKLYKAVDCVA